MLITLICKERIFELRLPEKITGRYWITDDENRGGEKRLLAIEASSDGYLWMLRRQNRAIIYDENLRETDCIYLQPYKLYALKLESKGNTVLYTETNY